MPKAKIGKAEKNKKHKLAKFIQKPKDRTRTKRDNQFVFTGFYERLKSIDVKHAHASLNSQSLLLDALQDNEYGERKALGDMTQDDLVSSNFIEMLRMELFKNKSDEFKRLFRQVERLCFSYPLLILNKTQVIDKLLEFLSDDKL